MRADRICKLYFLYHLIKIVSLVPLQILSEDGWQHVRLHRPCPIRLLIMKNFVLLIVFILLHLILAEAQTTVPEVANSPTDSTAESDASPQPSPVESEAAGASASGALPFKKRDPVRVVRFAEPPVIDGQLGDAVWERAAVLKDFYQISPGDNIAPSRDTRVYLGYDAKNLYIAFEAFDEPEEVRATLARRDAIFDDDNVRIYLDTFGDQRQAYLLIFNPYGVQADGIYMDGRGEDLSVDIVMDSKGTITEDGYIVEVAVPFKSLRYEAGKGKFWGVHASRRIKRFNNEADAWMPISRNIAGILTQAGRIYGLEGISTDRSYEIIPTLTLSQTGKRARSLPPSVSPNDPVALADPGRFVNPPIAFDPGLTAKFSITPTITLDFALNPDFAQVEADQTVITANQRFPIFFPEKRPFFLEGIEVFRTPIQAVNTRAIVDPDYAVKLTGKRGRNTFGLLVASDNAPGNYGEEDRTNPGLQKFIDKNALIGVLRLKRDIGNTDSN
ncbi:MAG: carbohydrate binding family 9 domain-containing protein, partial [Pyrinomonadaceae bacterium]|nr:carbohydrate binding family 9 domain-containing protein [Pyrinomonadaceae bacterium]